MSASYWNSSQRQKWQYTREELTRIRKDLGDGNSSIYTRIFLHSLVLKLGGKLNLRQVILSTAEVFLARFLTRCDISDVNSYALVTTCVYLACKTEESPIHIRNIVNESRNIWPEFIPSDPTKIAEFEFYLIEEMECYMVVHHPYTSLSQVVSVLKSDYKLSISNDETKVAWSIINDSYITDLPLLFPPHILAIAAVYMACILMETGKDSQEAKVSGLVKFLAVSNVDLDEAIEGVQEMLTLYENWNNYDETAVRNAVNHQILSANG